MTWLAWRQFRAPAAAGAALVTVFAAWIVVLGLRIHHFHDERIAGCAAAACGAATSLFVARFEGPVQTTGLLLLVVPALVGVFWGAPLVARELETGTHRLAWTQGISRTRWLAVKLLVLVLAAAITGGVLSALLTWAAAPYDALVGSRFGGAAFAARGVVPVGYAVFGLLLGITAGLLVRRTLPAMAITLVVLAGVQMAMPWLVRPHLERPVTVGVDARRAAEEGHFDSLGMSDDGPKAPVQIYGFTLPGAWVLSRESPIVRADGTPVTASDLDRCTTGSITGDFACLAGSGAVHIDVRYQPAARFWPFQGIETGLVLALGAGLAGVARYRIRRVG